MLDGYENPDPTAKPPNWADLKVPVKPVVPLSERILSHIDTLESSRSTARHSSFVVIPGRGIWRKMGNKTFYRLFNLRYLQHDQKKNGLQEAIDRARALEDPQKRLSLLRTAEIYAKIAARIGRGPLS